MNISPEHLAYWYLRLNGYLTIENFVVHPDGPGSQRTDIDLLAARFPHRAELLLKPMKDDHDLIVPGNRIQIAIAEVKTGKCDLNGPWTNPAGKNMERVIRAIGIVPKQNVDQISRELYNFGFWENDEFYVSLMCFGKVVNLQWMKTHPSIRQFTWEKVVKFIHTRFRKYRQQKVSHPQWDINGRNLWDWAMQADDHREMLGLMGYADNT